MKAYAILYKRLDNHTNIELCVLTGWTTQPDEKFDQLLVDLDKERLLATVKGYITDPTNGNNFFLYEFEVEVDEK